MLKYLHIENIAVIEMCDIEFLGGFNVLTGETGAGKSIVIDSINAVLGERTSRDLIRSGCDSAEVTALFGDLSAENLKTLEENDIFPDEDGNILITRKLSLSGKGIIKINGKPFTATALRDISACLINIHGQHDNQALLNPEKHCDFIDAVADNGNLREKYYNCFKNLNKIRKELNSLNTDEDEKARKTDLLKYQINELQTADIKVGEIEELKAKLQVAEEYDANLKAFSATSGILAGNEDTNGVVTNLKIASKLLGNLQNEKAQKCFSDINEIIDRTEEVSAEIRNFAEGLSENYQNPDEINERLDFLYGLMVKYGNSEEKMLKFLQNAQNELESITFADNRAEELATDRKSVV